MAPLGHIFVSDVVQGKIYKVRANHYPANVTVEMDHLEHPVLYRVQTECNCVQRLNWGNNCQCGQINC